LLNQLNEEVVILSTKEEKITLSKALESEYQAIHLDEHEVQVTISKDKSLNNLFEILNQEKISITSFRNKTNRLEALFVNITK
jgi:ABC-2 type transport system ATP-binding protein